MKHSINNRRLLRRLRTLAVPLLLSVVALVHLFHWATLNRSSWGTGCGFGMFATVDYHGSRFVRCHRRIDSIWQAIEIPEEFRNEELKLRIFPTDDQLERFSSRLRQQVPDADLRVEVWTMQIDNSRQLVRSRLLNRSISHGHGEFPGESDVVRR